MTSKRAPGISSATVRPSGGRAVNGQPAVLLVGGEAAVEPEAAAIAHRLGLDKQ
jgi:hypothetical protein